jgi:hypothetical protein
LPQKWCIRLSILNDWGQHSDQTGEQLTRCLPFPLIDAQIKTLETIRQDGAGWPGCKGLDQLAHNF